MFTGGWGEGCTVRSNASQVMVTWRPPMQRHSQTRMKTLPSLAGHKQGLQRYSQSHQLLSYWLLPKKPPAGMTHRGHSPIDGFRVGTMEQYQSNHGTAGNCEAGGFVNSAVRVMTNSILHVCWDQIQKNYKGPNYYFYFYLQNFTQ